MTKKKLTKYVKRLEERLESVECNLGLHFIQDHGYIDTGTEFVRAPEVIPAPLVGSTAYPRVSGLAAVDAQRTPERAYTEYSEPEGA